jgi:hypothetical protein
MENLKNWKFGFETPKFFAYKVIVNWLLIWRLAV